MIALRAGISRNKTPQMPAGVRIYAIGDIHGRVDLLDAVLKLIEIDLQKNPIPMAIEVYLGDYIDRGPASREVIDRLVERNRTFRGVFLKGNHESYLIKFTTNPPSASCGLFLPALQARHIGFLSNLRLSFACRDYFFVHAGVWPGIPLAKQREEDLLWIRQDFLLCEEGFSKIIVHGHPNRINIDTGAYATGRLTCLRLEDNRVDFIQVSS
jgi:serine/threonine protein phosphatase 1